MAALQNLPAGVRRCRAYGESPYSYLVADIVILHDSRMVAAVVLLLVKPGGLMRGFSCGVLVLGVGLIQNSRMASAPGVPVRLADRIAPGSLSPASLFVGLLLSADLMLVALHLMHTSVQVRTRLPVVKSPAFDLARDLGLAEAFGYVKLLWAVLLLVWLGTLGLRRSYLPWALLFGYLLIDDMFGAHERIGTQLVLVTGNDPERAIVSGLRVQDAGELAVSGSIGLVVLIMLVYCYRRGTARTRTTYRHLALATLVLAGFGVAVDMVARVFTSHTVELILYVVEDGGELVAVTGILGYVMLLAERIRPSTTSDSPPVADERRA